jgi:hypothetical protein
MTRPAPVTGPFSYPTCTWARRAARPALLDFLKAHPSEYLYLVGDIVDGWQLRRRWYWPQAHNDVVQKLLRARARAAACSMCRATTTNSRASSSATSLAASRCAKRRCTARLTAARCGSFTATISTA